MRIEVAASAPGKVILFGEHAVVHSQPAIAASLDDLRIYCSMIYSSLDEQENEKGLLMINMPHLKGGLVYRISMANARLSRADFDTDPKTPSKETLLALSEMIKVSNIDNKDEMREDEVEALLPLLFLLNGIVPYALVEDKSLTIIVRSEDLPVGAGLGSSAAFSVAVSAALYQLNFRLNDEQNADVLLHKKILTKHDLEVINSWAFAAEGVIHGNPSGLDNTVSCFGGAIYYQKDGSSRNMKSFHQLKIPPLDMVLSNTFIPRSTKALVAGVARRKEEYMFMNDVICAIGKISA